MEKLLFNKDKILIVPIEHVRPNPWNPKQKATPEYEKIKKGIELKGQRLPIVVRENNGYEILDGEQRWTACKELGYAKVIIYNEGMMEDKEAKELTIWYQQQVPFDEIKLAELITDLSNLSKNLEIPYTEEEVQKYKELNEFNWNRFDNDLKEFDNKGGKEVECPECGFKFIPSYGRGNTKN